MKKYNCEKCNYSSNDRGNFHKHKMSKRHMEISNNQDKKNKMLSDVIDPLSVCYHDNTAKRYVCTNCEYKTQYRSNYSRHIKLCPFKNIKEHELISKLQNMEKEKEIAQVRQEMAQKEIQFLHKQQQIHEQHVDLLRKLIASSYKGGNGSVTSTLYEHYPDNPPLKQIDYMRFNNLIKPTSKLVKEVLSSFKHSKLHEFLGNFILKLYKKKNYEDQSIFTSDTSRQNYVIKEIIHNVTSEWVPDKKGLKTIQYIIKPLTNHVLHHIKEYNAILTINNSAINIDDILDLTKRKNDILILESYIEDGKLDDKINKFICPFFVMDKNIIKKLDKDNKLLSLSFDKD